MEQRRPKIGFIGAGLMGAPMCLRLVQAGFSVTVWNRTKEKTRDLAECGAAVAETVADVTAAVDYVMLCLTDADAVRAVIDGADGVAAHGRAGQVVIDFSSIDPAATRELASSLSLSTGMHWIDAPVSGGVKGAEDGSLVIMAGGPATLVDEVRPLLAPLSQNVTHMGDVGAGQTTKIANQMIVICNLLVIAETLALAQKAGITSIKVPEALADGFADSKPLQLTGPRMAAGAFEPVKWHVRTLLKDIETALELAQSLGQTTPLTALARTLMQKHADNGYAQTDASTLIKLFTEEQDDAL